MMVWVLSPSKPHAAARARAQTMLQQTTLRRATEKSDSARMLKLIEAAEEVFLEKAHHHATMNDVAKAAGMSKKTVYKLIDSKSAMFAALIDRHEEKLVVPITQQDWTVIETLVQNLLSLGRYLLSPQHIAIIRLIMTEYTHKSDFVRAVHQKRVAKGRMMLEDCLLQITPMKPADVREMATMLFGMALGDFYLAALIGFRPVPGKAVLTRRIRHAVNLLLAGYEQLNP